MTLSSKHLALLAGTLLACGDGTATPDASVDAPVDAPFTAESFEGLWLMTSLTVPTATAPLTLRRDGAPQSLRADVVFTATGASGTTSGSLSVRQAPLAVGLLAEDVRHMVVQVALEPTRWRITEPEGTVAVFTATAQANHLQLDVAPTDPQHTSTGAPLQIVLDRVPSWMTTAVGGWNLVAMQLPDRLVTAGACVEVVAERTWGKVSMVIRFSDRLLFYREMTTTLYSDSSCTTQTSTSTSVQSGLAEHEGTTLRMWGLENGRAEYQVFTMALTGNDATLTRTSCLPTPACNDTAPLSVSVHRR